MIRRPLRPLARILSARAEGRDPNQIEAEERAARMRALERAERSKAEARLLLLGVAFILGFTAVAGRMALTAAAVPVEPRESLAADPIRAQRADIIDRNGAILATNLVTASLYAQPLDMIDPRRAADALAEIFPDLDAAALYNRFTDGRKFVWIKRTVSPEQRQAVHDLGEPGLLFGPRETRLYPNGAVAAHVLGGASFGREGVHAAEVIGVAGVERAEDARLRDPARVTEPLKLSIDLPAQTAMEQVLAEAMQRLDAKGAVGILMEADTGQIRVLASLPDFDPNMRPPLPTSGDPADSPLFNRAAQGRYELGSTFKIFAVAQGLERGAITPKTLIDTKGPMKWGRFTIRDGRGRDRQVLEHRCRPYRHLHGDPRPAAVPQEPRPDGRPPGRAERGRPGRAPRAGALVGPHYHDHLLRPRPRGLAPAPRGRLRHRGERRAQGHADAARERRPADRGRSGDLGGPFRPGPRHAAPGGGARHR